MTPPLLNRVTLKDIAIEMGVSKTAVSQALSGRGRISSSMREKIVRRANEMGYRQDPDASRLAMHRWKTTEDPLAQRNIALITHVRKELQPFGKKIRDMAANYAREAGHGFIHIELSKYTRASTWKNLLESRGVEGVIVAAGFELSMLSDPFWDQFIVVKCGALNKDDLAHGVHIDAFTRVQNATTLLYERGFHRPGFVFLHHTPFHSDDIQRISAQKTLPLLFPDIDLPKPLIFPFHLLHNLEKNDFDSPHLRIKHMEPLIPSLRKWLKEETPDVVVGMNSLVFDALVESGIKIPEQLSFFSLNVSELSAHQSFRITGYMRSRKKSVTQALRLLEQLLQNPIKTQGGRLRVIVPDELCEGHTLRSPALESQK